MSIFLSLAAVLVLILLTWLGVGVGGLEYLFAVVFPYAAVALFLVGVVYRVLVWARAPVPFRIPTTCGQQKTLPWIKSSKLESPHTLLGVLGRMAVEVLFFRSLFRNTRGTLTDDSRLVYSYTKWLWAAGLAFHWCFLFVLVRHIRFFTEPVPGFVGIVQGLDGFFQVGLPVIYATDVAIVGALTFLFFRRIFDLKVRYISLAADYFPLLLLLGIVLSGVWVRYLGKTDIVAVKEISMGLLTFSPVVPEGIGVMFFIHLLLVCVLLAYFPFSKLMHMAGVFFSPTRNLANNNRMRRHINPWDHPVKVHTYQEYEDEFRDVMKAADIPVEKE